jgi:excisionase family DNA binding protein
MLKVGIASEKDVWDVHDVAQLLGVHHSWVYERVRSKEIPFRRLGPRLVRFDPDAVRAWAKGREH